MLQALLKAGAKASVRDNDGDTPVHYACAQGHIACIKALAAAPGGCDLEAVDNDGATPMDVAARCAPPASSVCRPAGLTLSAFPRSARVKTTLRALIADAAKGSESGSDGEGWEEADGEEATEALAALDIAKAEAKPEAKGKTGKKR